MSFKITLHANLGRLQHGLKTASTVEPVDLQNAQFDIQEKLSSTASFTRATINIYQQYSKIFKVKVDFQRCLLGSTNFTL